MLLHDEYYNSDTIYPNKNIPMKTILILIIVTTALHLNGQNIYNNKQVYKCTKAIQAKVDSLQNKGNIEKMMSMMIDSINACVEGLSLREFSFEPINGDQIILRNLVKPTILKVSTSGCAPCLAEIPAINRIAEEFKEEIKVIVLFWDDETYIKKNSKKYSPTIDLVPQMKGNETNVKFEISGFKHYIGWPAIYFLDNTQTIKYLTRGAVMPSEKTENAKEVTLVEANDRNYERMKKHVIKLLNQ